MRGEYHRLPLLTRSTEQMADNAPAHYVERFKRLVEQQHGTTQTQHTDECELAQCAVRIGINEVVDRDVECRCLTQRDRRKRAVTA